MSSVRSRSPAPTVRRDGAQPISAELEKLHGLRVERNALATAKLRLRPFAIARRHDLSAVRAVGSGPDRRYVAPHLRVEEHTAGEFLRVDDDDEVAELARDGHVVGIVHADHL